MSVQTSVDQAPVRAYEGQIADGSPRYAVSAVAEGSVRPGQPMLRGTDEDRQALSIGDGVTVDATTQLGILIHDPAFPEDRITAGEYDDESQVSVLRFGVIYVLAESAVTAGNPVYVGNVLSPLTLDHYEDATDTGMVALVGARWLQSGGAGELLKISINMMG